MRTLAELPVREVFPAEYIYDAVLPASKEEAADRAMQNKGCDPFLRITLPKKSMQTELEEFDVDRDGQLNRTESDSKQRKIKKLVTELTRKLRDQLINVISQEFAPGHLAKDLGLRQLSEWYVFGVTYEVEGTQKVNRKLRCLLIQRKLLEKLERGSQHLCVHASFPYKESRWWHLQQLKELWDQRDRTSMNNQSDLGQKLHNVLIGELELVVNGGELDLTNDFSRASSPQPFVYRAGSPAGKIIQDRHRRVPMAAAATAAAPGTSGVSGVRDRRPARSRSPSTSPSRIRSSSPASTGRSVAARRGSRPSARKPRR